MLPRYLKPLHFCKADISLISAKNYPNLAQHRYYILSKKGLNNLIAKTQYNCYSSFSDKNTPPQTNNNTSPGRSTTKNDLINSPKGNMNKTSMVESNVTISNNIFSSLLSTFSKKQPLIGRIREIINKIKNKDRHHMLNTASKILNEFTGYSAVEKLKEKVIQQGNFFPLHSIFI